jgi:hypothetical protein
MVNRLSEKYFPRRTVNNIDNVNGSNVIKVQSKNREDAQAITHNPNEGYKSAVQPRFS